jgi:hypothetical protein
MPEELRKAQIIMCGVWAGKSGPAVNQCKAEEAQIYNDAKARVGTDKKSLQRFVEFYRKSFAAPFETCARGKPVLAGGQWTPAVADQVHTCMQTYRRGITGRNAGKITVYKVDTSGRVLRSNRERMTRGNFINYIVDLAKCTGGKCEYIMPFPPNVVKFANKLGGRLGAQFLRLYTDLMARAPEKMQTEFKKKANTYREKVGDSLIATVKRRLRFTNPSSITAAQRPNMEKRLAATLGHGINGSLQLRGNRVTGTVTVVVKEVGRGREVPGSLGTKYEVIDGKRNLLNDAYYLRFEKKSKARSLIRNASLKVAAQVLNKDLGKFLAKNKDMDVRDVRVIGIETHSIKLGGLRGTHKVIKKIRFALELGPPKELIRNVVMNNPLVKNKYLGMVALRRIWSDILQKDPSVGRSSKRRRAYAKFLGKKLPRMIRANEARKIHKDPRTQKPDGAYLLLNTHVKKINNVKSASPTPVLVTVPPGHPAYRDYGHDAMKNAKNIVVRRPVFKLANPKIKAIVGKVTDPAKKAALKKALEGKVHRAAEKKVIKLFDDPKNSNRKAWALLGSRVRKVTITPKKDASGRPIIDPDTGQPDYDVTIVLDEPGGTKMTKDGRTTYKVFSISRVGVGYRDAGSAADELGLERKKATGSGYIYSNFEVDTLLKSGAIVFVKGSILMASEQGYPVHVARVPHGELPGHNITRINGLEVGVKGNLGDTLTGAIAIGYMTFRGKQIFKDGDIGPFDWTDHQHEIAPTTGSSKGYGLSGNIKYQPNAKKNSFVRLTVAGGNAWQFALGKDIKDHNWSQRVVAGLDGQIDLGKAILAGAVSFDHSGPSIISVPRPGGGAEEFKTKGSNGVLAQAGLLYKITQNTSVVLGGSVFWQKLMGDTQPGDQLQANATVGVRYMPKGRGLKAAFNVGWMGIRNVTDNSQLSTWGQGGEDGTHDPMLHAISLDAFLGYSFKLDFWKGAEFMPGIYVNAGIDPSSGQHSVSGGLQLTLSR